MSYLTPVEAAGCKRFPLCIQMLAQRLPFLHRLLNPFDFALCLFTIPCMMSTRMATAVRAHAAWLDPYPSLDRPAIER